MRQQSPPLDESDAEDLITEICHYLAFDHQPSQQQVRATEIASAVDASERACEWALDELARRDSRVRRRERTTTGPVWVLHDDR